MPDAATASAGANIAKAISATPITTMNTGHQRSSGDVLFLSASAFGAGVLFARDGVEGSGDERGTLVAMSLPAGRAAGIEINVVAAGRGAGAGGDDGLTSSRNSVAYCGTATAKPSRNCSVSSNRSFGSFASARSISDCQCAFSGGKRGTASNTCA